VVSGPPAQGQVARPKGRATTAVVLERTDDVAQADTTYCVHGQVQCGVCGAWCWLGNETYKLVSSGSAAPLCMPCARTRVPADARRVRGANDHRRSAGPHD
jgi:hypothetical protein